VLPTPAVATLVGQLRADAGVAVSASHNPLPDNGIKIINHNGFKASPEGEQILEERLLEDHTKVSGDLDDLEPDPALAQTYLNQLREIASHQDIDLSGLRIVIDAGNGAASPFAAKLFRGLGAEVISMGDRPDGTNINLACGSTAPETMAKAVLEHRADIGIAFDGDADRAIFVDDQGQIRDGDAALFLWARDLESQNALDPAAIVATSMSNLGLEVALRKAEIEVIRCDVGDRTVVSTMLRDGVCLGGEQSGHIVHLGLSTAGDGLLTGLQLAGIRAKSDETLSAMLEGFQRFPQVLENIRVRSKPDLGSLSSVASSVEEVERQLGDSGRLVLRYSGTEPLARVMIEGPDQEVIAELAAKIIRAIDQEIGAE
jgi:phosphoglucosamine mutase